MTGVMSTITDQVQIALFPNDFEIKSPSSLSAKLIDQDFISGENLVINSFLTSSAPGEILRIEAVLKEDSNVQLKIAQKKVSLYFTNPSSSASFKVDVAKIEDSIKKINNLFLQGHTFNRVGYITTVFQVVEDPVSLFKVKINFTNKDTLKDAEAKLTFITEFNKKEWASIEFNKHLVLGTGYVTSDPSQKTAILQYDLNVRQDQNPKWDIDNAIEFVKKANSISADSDAIFKEVFNK